MAKQSFKKIKFTRRSNQQTTIGQSFMTNHFTFYFTRRQYSFQLIIYEQHQRKIFKTVFVVFHKIPAKQKRTVFGFVHKSVPLLFKRIGVAFYFNCMCTFHPENEIT